MFEWQPVWLSIKVALASLGFVVLLGVSAAYVMRRSEFAGKAAVEAVFSLPLVLPPVVTGFLLLLLIGKQGPIGRFLADSFDLQLIFTPYAAVIAGTVVAFPLMYQSTKAAFQSIDAKLEDAARTLGANEWRVFWTVSLPLAWHGLLSGIVLSFSRALGEFGATIMFAGNIPGVTQTMSTAVYAAVQANDYDLAFNWAIVIIVFSLVFVTLMNALIARTGAPQRREV